MLNNITLMGRLTAAPELRQTAGGIPMASFTLAVERDFKGQDGQRQTDFIPCVAWRRTAEFIAQYFPKGAMLALTGSLQTDKYTDRAGNARTGFRVVVEKASFTGEKSGSRNEPPAYPPAQPPVQQGGSMYGGNEWIFPPEDEPLPF